MKFNINNNVRVKLTDAGKEILRRQFDEMNKTFPKAFGEFKLPEEDQEGWSEWEMSTLMQYLGKHIVAGYQLPFETDIEIVE
jgi:hypothetical protein